jgi:hypothetical protein
LQVASLSVGEVVLKRSITPGRLHAEALLIYEANLVRDRGTELHPFAREGAHYAP